MFQFDPKTLGLVGGVLVLQFLMGLLASVIQMAITRLAMAVIPVMGRNHFFAIYSTIGNVTLGLAPIGWGLLIDAVGARSPVWLGLAWNRFTIWPPPWRAPTSS